MLQIKWFPQSIKTTLPAADNYTYKVRLYICVTYTYVCGQKIWFYEKISTMCWNNHEIFIQCNEVCFFPKQRISDIDNKWCYFYMLWLAFLFLSRPCHCSYYTLNFFLSQPKLIRSIKIAREKKSITKISLLWLQLACFGGDKTEPSHNRINMVPIHFLSMK